MTPPSFLNNQRFHSCDHVSVFFSFPVIFLPLLSRLSLDDQILSFIRTQTFRTNPSSYPSLPADVDLLPVLEPTTDVAHHHHSVAAIADDDAAEVLEDNEPCWEVVVESMVVMDDVEVVLEKVKRK